MSNKLESLKIAHAAAYREFQPRLGEYSRLAGEVLRLQVEIVKESLKQELASVPVVEKVLVCKISAREPLAAADRALESLKTAGTILEVVYDPSRFEFLVFGKA